jgi:hypothetical protein
MAVVARSNADAGPGGDAAPDLQVTTDDGKPVGDAAALAQQSVWGADASVTDTTGEELLRDGHTVVRISPGTRLSAGFDPGALSISADPGFSVETLGPTVRITSVRYDFATARFQTYGSARFDVLGTWASIVRSSVEKALEQRYRSQLPAAMQRPGYQPANDPQLQSTIQGLMRLFGDPGGDTAAAARRFVDPSAFAQLVAPESLHVPLGTDQLELYLAKGTMLSLSVQAGGGLDHPHLKLLTVRSSSGPGLALRSTGKGVLDSLKGLTMKEVTIHPGGVFSFDYDLDIEQMADGFTALVALIGLAAGEHVDRVPQTKLDSVRKELDARLQKEVPPAFRAFLARFDQVLPGFSLTDIFGVKQ